jgi:hypothetical protein
MGWTKNSSPKRKNVMKCYMERWVRHVAQMVNMRSAYRVLVRKSEGKRPLT